MADAGLDADVVLDIRTALAAVGRLEAELDRASHVVVTADARAVTGAIDAAVQNADTGVAIVAEAANVTGAIDAAVDNADTTVTVQGNVDPELRGDVIQLGDSLDEAGDSAGHLRQVIGLLSVGAAVAGLRALADAASDLQESTSKAAVVFGDNFTDIQKFAETAAESTGLAAQDALEAAGTFGNLFQALGQTREEASRMSPEVVQLAADLASFNNLEVDEVLEKLRSGLVGEVEPLRSLGVSFLAADVERKAFELGLVSANGVVTEGAKVQARLALIMEQTTLAQGDFARTSQGLANQQRILGAEFKNAAASAGTLLLPAFEALVAEARGVLPSIEELGSTLLPALSDAIVNLAPLLGTTVDLFVLASPALAAVLEVVAAIPTELIQLVAALVLVNKGMSLLQSTTAGVPAALRLLPKILDGTASAAKGAANQAGPLAKGITGIGESLATVNPLMIGAGLLAAGLFKTWSDGKDRAADVKRQTDELGKSFAQVGDGIESGRAAIRTWIDDMVEADSKIESTNKLLDEQVKVGDVLSALGLSAADLANLLAGGTEAVDEFADSLGDLTDDQKVALGLTSDLAKQSGDAAKATLQARAATDQLTAAQKAELDALVARNAPTEDYVRLLDESTRQQERAAAAAERTKSAYGPLADQFVATGEALTALRDSAPDVASRISSLRSGGVEPTARAFQDLVFAIGDAALSEEDMADAAALLGTDVETLTTLTETAQDALDSFVDTATGALPSIDDAFKNTGKNGKLSIEEFVDGLNDSADRIADFRLRLAILAQAGFSDIAAIIAEQGPEVGGLLASELVTALQDGNVEVLNTVREATTGFNQEWQDTAAFFRDTIGPEMILQSGLLGAGITEAFGSELGFSERIRIAAALAKSGLSTEGQAVAAIAAVEGARAARDYGTALNLDDQTVQAAIEAGVAIKANAPTGAARTAGTETGKNFGAGVVDGMTLYIDDVSTKAQQLVLSARAAAKRTAQEGSPSKLFRELGVNIALGVAEGIDAEVASVAASAQQLVVSAAAAATAVPTATIDLTGAVSADDGGSGASVIFGPGSVVVQPPVGMTREEAVVVGEGIIDGAARALEARRIAVLGRVQ